MSQSAQRQITVATADIARHMYFMLKPTRRSESPPGSARFLANDGIMPTIAADMVIPSVLRTRLAVSTRWWQVGQRVSRLSSWLAISAEEKLRKGILWWTSCCREFSGSPHTWQR